LQAKALEERQKLLSNIDPLADDKELESKLENIDLQAKMTGGLYTRANKEVVITDINLLPREYLERRCCRLSSAILTILFVALQNSVYARAMWHMISRT
jgi:hypothetical protein